MDIISYLKTKHHIVLNDQQKQGVLSKEKNTLLLAVPGSGKTTVLVSHIADLILNHGVFPEQILTLTFSRETARDMKNRYCMLFNDLTDKIPIFSTIHSFCFRVLKYYSEIYHRDMPRLISEMGSLRKKVLKEIYKKHTGKYLSDDKFEILDNSIGCAKNLLLSKDQLLLKEREIKEFYKIFVDYEAYKRQNKLMDFDDMLTIVLEIFQKCPAVLTYFQKHYNNIIVDEAQDTSLVQHKIIALIAKNVRIFMVGDEDQSIYGFRGAYPKALLEFGDIYDNSSVIKMEQNFRSNGDIVSNANRFIKQNHQRYDKNMFCENEKNKSIKKISLIDYNLQYQKAFELLKDCPKENMIAVLYRNNESAIPLIDLFYQNGIDFYIKEHRISYFDSSAVRDITAYIILASDPYDLDAFSQIYYKLGYSKGIFNYVKEHVREFDSIFDCILSISSVTGYQRFRTKEYVKKFCFLLNMKPVKAIKYICNNLNYKKYIEKNIQDECVRTAFYQKINTALCLAQGVSTVFSFLEKLSDLKKAIELRKNINVSSNITLSTLHSAKGMEFDTVIMIDMLENIIPANSAVLESEHDEYENDVRLFYVGITRAKSRLIFFTSNRMNGELVNSSSFINYYFGKSVSVTANSKKNVLPDILGRKIYHVIFGYGVVISQKGDMVFVEFESFGKKQLSLQVCLENGIIRVK